MKTDERMTELLREREKIQTAFNTRRSWRGNEQRTMVARLEIVEQEIDLLTPDEHVLRSPW